MTDINKHTYKDVGIRLPASLKGRAGSMYLAISMREVGKVVLGKVLNATRPPAYEQLHTGTWDVTFTEIYTMNNEI